MIDDSYKTKRITWPNGSEYFKKTNVEAIIRDIENTPEQLLEQMSTLVNCPQETRQYNSDQ